MMQMPPHDPRDDAQVTGGPDDRALDDRALDEALEQTFPASDPISIIQPMTSMRVNFEERPARTGHRGFGNDDSVGGEKASFAEILNQPR